MDKRVGKPRTPGDACGVSPGRVSAGESGMSDDLCEHDSRLVIPSYWSMFSIGLVFGLLGPILTPISDSFRLDLGQMGFPVASFFTGFLASTLFVAFVWQIQRARLMMVSSSLLLLASLVGIFLFRINLAVLLAQFFLLGVGAGMLHTGIASLTSQVSGDMRVRYLNILHLFIGAGALVGPLFVGVTLTYGGEWQHVFLLVAVFALPLPILFPKKAFVRRKTFSTGPKTASGSDLPVPVDWTILLPIIIAMFLFGGLEASFGSWTPVFLVRERSMSAAAASYIMCTFWLATIAGRYLFARFLYKGDLSRFLVIAGAAGALFASLTFLMRETVLTVVFVACSGLALSCMYPGILASGGNAFPRSVGFVTGMLIAGGIAGSVFFPWLVGPMSEITGLGTGIVLIPLVGILLMAILSYSRHCLTRRYRPGTRKRANPSPE